jgi:hypothetical protein
VAQFSVPLQMPSPHRGAVWQAPQSTAQVPHVSPGLHTLSPQRTAGGHDPQSAGQLVQFSLAPHTPSPHEPASGAHVLVAAQQIAAPAPWKLQSGVLQQPQ